MSWQAQIKKADREQQAVEKRLRAVVRGREREVAEAMGTSRTAVYGWLSGDRRVSRDWLHRLARALDDMAVAARGKT